MVINTIIGILSFILGLFIGWLVFTKYFLSFDTKKFKHWKKEFSNLKK